jgi:glutamate racemase
VVLACTHYPLLLNRLKSLAPWPVNFVDPAPAIGRRVLELLGPAVPSVAATTSTRYIFTSGKAPSAALQAALDQFGHRRSAHGLPTQPETERLPT